ncbi:hypothetical protein CASFOL_026755 [Castilleja foliolosa]|uniref:Uncharacterized protein n=1 Tax=Castilleja foliolosa TaxID=1961234 RepID=A0ABD3CHZ3_9LAMI
MFNKNNTYLFPHDHSHHHHHHHHPRSSVVDLNNAELFLHNHHHPDIFSGHHYNIPAHMIPDHLASPNLHESGNSKSGKPQTPKKDRHSKIYTSQGPRDRRVRLSIGIARKFFDLQEMLGVDKPSKTLDWLLTKSKTAIKELVQTKDNMTNKTGSGSECDEDTLKGRSGNKNIRESGSSSMSLTKESRAKARARARERTREKMQMKNVINNDSTTQYQDLIQESVLIKRKTKNNVGPPTFFGFHQQNVFVSRDSGSSYGGVPFATNGAHENWDVCSFTSQSNMCAIWDQHNFMNSSSNNM